MAAAALVLPALAFTLFLAPSVEAQEAAELVAPVPQKEEPATSTLPVPTAPRGLESFLPLVALVGAALFAAAGAVRRPRREKVPQPRAPHPRDAIV